MEQKEQTITIRIEKGECLHDALLRQGYASELPCGGNGTCGLCSVYVERFGKVKACQFRLPGEYRVTGMAQTGFAAVSSRPSDLLPSGDDRTAFVAIDIGTTTVAWKAGFRGKLLSGGFVNPQRRYGADVLSRIRQCEAGNETSMQQLLAKALSESLAQALQPLIQEDPIDSVQIAIAANTTMLHILNGWDCTGLGKAPFTPHSLAKAAWNKAEWNRILPTEWLGFCRSCTVTELPGISAFIGADIVSGMLATQMTDTGEITLLVDLGTNGEMVLGSRDGFLAASTAAGPAFEASEAALKLHASGIFKALRRMRESKVMDETGLLAEPFFTDGYPVEGTIITQDMIRDFQMAKAAIRAGIDILLKEYGITAKEVERIYLAGGMGYYMDPEDAIAIGLLPEVDRRRVYAAGNTSLRGLERFLGEPETAAEQMERAIAVTKEIVLAEHPDFEEAYLENMSFPAGQEN